MDSGRRAVESYWRSRIIDGATSDEDKVTPVYKLEEICELLRSSHVSIVKEVSEFILKRLDHKSPIVKQKVLRLIKYAVVKSGAEFRREMQRHSVVIRQLFHYKGQLDPLKGDASNKAVRDTAHEAIAAIFAEENNKPAPVEERGRRIEGFGNTNFSIMPSEDKKSFISEVVGIGSASFKQGLSNFTQSQSLRKNDSGSYKSPTLHRSLTIENEYTGRYEPVDYRNERQVSFGMSKDAASGSWNQDSRLANTEVAYGNSSSSHTGTGSKILEERLLETIVTSGGVRLQPTRDAIHVFLGQAAKLDMLALSHALKTKLQSPQWQVRMKAMCVLEAVLRKKDDEHFSIVSSFFSENKDSVVSCSESPQASLREKAVKVLSLLGGEQGGGACISENPLQVETANVVQMRDLIDASDLDEYHSASISTEKQSNQNTQTPTTSNLLIDDLLGDAPSTSASTSEQKNDDDPFADVSFHTSESKESVDDIFSGTSVDNKHNTNENHISGKKNCPELFDVCGSNSEVLQQKNVDDLIVGLSMKENGSTTMQNDTFTGLLSEAFPLGSNNQPVRQVSNDDLSGILGSQTSGMHADVLFHQGSLPYNVSSGVFNQAFPAQQMNYGAMGNLIAQHLATMSGFQQLSNINSQSTNVGHVAGTNGGYSSPLPDIFQPNFPNPVQNPTSSSKKDDTRAFDFISNHLAAARDTKRT